MVEAQCDHEAIRLHIERLVRETDGHTVAMNVQGYADLAAVRLAYADWLDEQGRVRDAACQRWLARNNRRPTANPSAWLWYGSSLSRRNGFGSELPPAVLNSMRPWHAVGVAQAERLVADALERLGVSADGYLSGEARDDC